MNGISKGAVIVSSFVLSYIAAFFVLKYGLGRHLSYGVLVGLMPSQWLVRRLNNYFDRSDAYFVLGLSSGASTEEVEGAYRELKEGYGKPGSSNEQVAPLEKAYAILTKKAA